MTDNALSQGNETLINALINAAGAIQQLDLQGVTVQDIDIRGGQPVLRIKRPPPFVRGVCRMRAPTGRYRLSLFAAPYHGVQLEWQTYERRPAALGAVR
jgi:hypothetical protein